MFFNFAFKFRSVSENFFTVQKIIELIFSLFPFDAIVVYPNANYRKKVHGVVLVYVLLSRLPTFCVFNVVVNHSIYCERFQPRSQLFVKRECATIDCHCPFKV